MLLLVDVEPFAPLLLTLTRRSYLDEVIYEASMDVKNFLSRP